MYEYLFSKNFEANSSTTTGWTALHSAASGGYIQICEFIMTKIVDKNPRDASNGDTPLHVAANKGYIEVCRALMKDNPIVNHQNDYGYTPLHCAAKKGHLEVYALISDGFKAINPFDGGFERTPLYFAAQHGHLLICQFILENTAVKNPKSKGANFGVNAAHHQAVTNLEGVIDFSHCRCNIYKA